MKLGGKQEWCRPCGQIFSGTSAGDMHRVGKHHIDTGPERRRCLSIAEMEAIGMVQDGRGVWMTRAREDETSDLSPTVRT